MEEALEIFERLWTETPLTYEANTTRSMCRSYAPTGAAAWPATVAQRDLAGVLHRMRRRGIPILTARLAVPRIREPGRCMRGAG